MINAKRSSLRRRRRAAQWVSAILYNANLPGFFQGSLYQGKLKGVCVPGLNCYSCPGAMGACPLGSFQGALTQMKSSALIYVLGVLLLVGALLGRFVCGWLCPIGLVQDCVYAVPVKKLRAKRLGPLKYLRYAVLILLAVALPVLTHYTRGVGVPMFCKLVCPAGTLAGIALRIAPGGSALPIGTTFLWKCAVLIGILALGMFLLRPFCRFLCPLGAIYGLFNKIALLGMRRDDALCTRCGRCVSACPMGVNPLRDCNDFDCIRCGKCVSACPTGALRFALPFGKPRAAVPSKAPSADEGRKAP